MICKLNSFCNEPNNCTYMYLFTFYWITYSYLCIIFKGALNFCRKPLRIFVLLHLFSFLSFIQKIIVIFIYCSLQIKRYFRCIAILLVLLQRINNLWLRIQGCELRSPLETLVSNGDFFGKNLGNWSPNGLLLRSKSPCPLKFLAFHKKMNKI